MQLCRAILYVKDLERMKRFYGEMLGVHPSTQGWSDSWATFQTGGIRFSLHAIPAEIGKSIEIESPPIPREEIPVKLVFEVMDVELERARLESLGIHTLRRPWQKLGEACDAVDPEGNVFQICSPAVSLNEFYKKGCQEKSFAATGGDFFSRSSPLCFVIPEQA